VADPVFLFSHLDWFEMGRYSEALQKIEEERKKKGLDPFQKPSSRNHFAFRNYTIGILAVLIIVLVIVYIYGVQKGMHLASVSSPVRNSPEAQKPLNEVAASEGDTALLENLERMMKMSYEAKPQVPTSGVAPTVSSQETKQNKTDFYTIQLAAYQDIVHAREEAGKLNQEGYRAIILRSNKYFAVCIDKFDNKSQADTRLAEIKNALGETMYPGAWIHFVKAKTAQSHASAKIT